LNQNGTDATDKFSGYVLAFYNGGLVTALKEGGSTVKGQWSTSHTDNKNGLLLNFAGDTTFDALNKQWQVNELLVNRIRFQSVSRGQIGTDELVLEAI
ncbi:MAG: hypothetical protein ACXVPQ_11085, partial [Bacteroidia bacterium]